MFTIIPGARPRGYVWHLLAWPDPEGYVGHLLAWPRPRAAQNDSGQNEKAAGAVGTEGTVGTAPGSLVNTPQPQMRGRPELRGGVFTTIWGNLKIPDLFWDFAHGCERLL